MLNLLRASCMVLSFTLLVASAGIVQADNGGTHASDEANKFWQQGKTLWEQLEFRKAKKPFLEAGPYIQSDSDEIINLSREIVGGEKNSWEAARKINAWVYENIDRRFTPDLSNALQTLHSRQGDCGEYTALTVALMRAAGIPTRPVTGMVYYPPGDGFGYHAWIEAFVGDWIMMDSSWGEDIVNPTHIALARGDLLEQIRIINRVLGKIDIEVLEAR